MDYQFKLLHTIAVNTERFVGFGAFFIGRENSGDEHFVAAYVNRYSNRIGNPATERVGSKNDVIDIDIVNGCCQWIGAITAG